MVNDKDQVSKLNQKKQAVTNNETESVATTTKTRQPVFRKTLMVLAVLGMLVSGYMFYAKLNTSALVCGISPCYTVNESQYSYLFGIPLSVYGIAFYLMVFLLALVKKYKVLFAFSVFGVLFSAYLTYLEFFVIYAWCQWCIASAILTVLIFAVSLLLLKFGKE